MKSVKVEDSVAEKLRDLKKHIRTGENLHVTQAEILSRAFELALERRRDLVERLRHRGEPGRDAWEFWLQPTDAGKATDAARDHDAVRP